MAASPDLDVALEACVALDEDTLGRKWSFRDQPMSYRYALYRTVEEAQEAYVRVTAQSHPESRRILALAQRAFGDLRGLLIGLPDDFLDRPPRDGEWPIRDTLRHVLTVERRYAGQTAYAVERADSDPVRIPDHRLPSAAEIDVGGSIREILARIGEARADTDRRLGDLAPAMMTRPTVWMQYDIDVRFRLHRFAAHVAEHTVQCEKSLMALGRNPTEGRRIARQLAALLGEIAGLGGTSAVQEIAATLRRRLAEIPTS